LIVFVVIAILFVMQSQLATYGVALVGVGATTLAWTAFRVHEKSFREAALVPENIVHDETPYQEQVSMTSQNYVDGLVGVLLVVIGFTLRVASMLA
jgi:hypothetical protein